MITLRKLTGKPSVSGGFSTLAQGNGYQKVNITINHYHIITTISHH